jgi:hypothetical protein
MKKKLIDDEIDLIDIFQIIWKKKKIIISSVIISLFLAFLIQIPTYKSYTKKKIKITTNIKAIKMVDESKYKAYNSFLKIINQPFNENIIYYLDSKQIVTDDDGTVKGIKNLAPQEQIRLTNNDIEINNINKNFLLNLFIEEVSERSNLERIIKKFNYIKEENYLNKIEYENAIKKILSNIRILNSKDESYNNITIEHETHDAERGKNFLKFLEQEINRIVLTKLVAMFDNYLAYIKMIKDFKIEELESKLLTVKNDKERMILNKKLIDLKSDNYDERITAIFNFSPMSNSEKFYAAKIDYDYMMVIEEITKPLKNLYLIAILLGGIFGIFFVLIQNAIQKRS